MSRCPARWRVHALALLVFALPALAAADVEADLRADLVGRYGIVAGELVSECTDHFTDMKVVGGRLTGGTGVRFERGELVKIDNVHAGALSGLDVNLTLVEPYRISFVDGPFTVYDQRRCRVQLNFEVGREVRKDRARAREAVAALIALYDDPAAAKRAGWNQRQVQPYPKDWEKKEVEYRRWKVAEVNRLVREKSERVLDDANRVLNYMSSDDDYLLSFAAGARARSDSWSSCEAMLAASFYSSGSGKNSRGWSDGQRVAWANHLAHALQSCYLENLD